MHRRIGFAVSMCGMVFVMLTLARVLQPPDHVICTVGFALVIIGIYFAIESVARKP